MVKVVNFTDTKSVRHPIPLLRTMMNCLRFYFIWKLIYKFYIYILPQEKKKSYQKNFFKDWFFEKYNQKTSPKLEKKEYKSPT